MRKLALIVGLVVGVLGLSGCGSNYKCDSKEYAESALNLVLFGKAEGSGDKDFTYQTLGFEIGDDIMLAKLEKDKKQSICKANISNKIVTQLAQDIQSGNRNALESRIKNIDEGLASVLALTNDFTIMYLGADFYKVFYKNNEKVDFDEAKTIAGMAAIAVALANNGMTYRVYDNGNGDLMINADYK